MLYVLLLHSPPALTLPVSSSSGPNGLQAAPRSPGSADPPTATAFSGSVVGSTRDIKVNPRNTWFPVPSPGLLLGEGFPDTPRQGTSSHKGLVRRLGSALHTLTVGMLCVPLAGQRGPQGKNRVLFLFVTCMSPSVPGTG